MRHRAAALAVALVACSSGTPEPAPSEGDGASTSVPSDTAPVETATASAPPAGTSAPHDASSALPREIMRKDCAALAQKYGDLVRAEESAKLSPKLTDAQRQTAHDNIAKGAQQLADRFAEGCEKSLVGKFADEAALKCAMGARTIAAFDTCMNGPTEAAPK